jgi:hypothetical protein
MTFQNLKHINFGLVLGMSTRKGTVRFLDDILRDTADKMHEVMRANDVKYAQVEEPDKIADILGISAVIVQDMSGKRYVALAARRGLIWPGRTRTTDRIQDQQLYLRYGSDDIVRRGHWPLPAIFARPAVLNY